MVRRLAACEACRPGLVGGCAMRPTWYASDLHEETQGELYGSYDLSILENVEMSRMSTFADARGRRRGCEKLLVDVNAGCEGQLTVGSVLS